MSKDVRVRFAPSPTGYLHVGGVRTALFNYLFARHHNGKFILRIEDTDQERSTSEAVTQILASLEWLGLKWDEGPYFQSQRREIYRVHLQQLLEKRKAYCCYCTQEELRVKRDRAIREKRPYKYDGTCRNLDPNEKPRGRPFTVRLKTPDNVPDHFDDLIKGRIPIDRATLDDWILARSDGTPTYNFCVVVDDALMRVSHVIRGNDHVNNTPKQILLYQAFGYNIPKFAHIPLVHGPDGSKLSKRKEEQYRKFGISVCVEEYQNMGYLPCALVNYFTRLGWSYGDQEIFSRDELIKLFDLKNIGISRSIMNPDKLRWLNAHYIKETPDSELAGLLVPVLSKMGVQVDANERIKRIAGCLKERTKTLEEMAHSAMFFFCAPEHYDTKAKDKWCVGHGDKILHAVRTVLASADTNDEKTMERSFRKIAYELGEGKLSKVVQPLRIALTGTSTSPPIFTVLSILGHEETLRRIDKALAEMKATL